MPTTAVELSGLELFEGCTDEDLAALTRAVTGVRRVREGEVVCAEDEVADRWWIVVEGQADATWRGLYLGTILAGETIGELALLDGKPRTATVTATTDMVLQELDGEGFVAALLRGPARGRGPAPPVRRPPPGHRRVAGAAGHTAPAATAPPPHGRGRRHAPPSVRSGSRRVFRGSVRPSGATAGAGGGALVRGGQLLGCDPLRGRAPAQPGPVVARIGRHPGPRRHPHRTAVGCPPGAGGSTRP